VVFNVSAAFADNSQIWGDSLKAALSVSKGELILFDDDNVYAKLTKNHEITNFTN